MAAPPLGWRRGYDKGMAWEAAIGGSAVDALVASAAVVAAEGVEMTYPGAASGAPATPVLRGVDLAVAAGECVALTGPSGGGKTTLLNLLGGMDRPTRGRVLLAGQDTARLDDAALTRLRRRAVGFVFQFFHLLPALTAMENIALPLELTGELSTAAIAVVSREALALVGMEEYADRYPGRLSGGQRQRVALARALAPRPQLILAEEPTGNLDRQSAQQVMALLRDLSRAQGAAVVLATHSAEAAAFASRVLPLRDGRLAAAAAPPRDDAATP
jgi:ABC-type lipoprotein export system ATPase subunit